MPVSSKFVYVGRDLEAMAFAVRYHGWILDVFNRYLGRKVVEVGAGSGLFSELLLKRGPQSLSLVEPSEKMHGILADRMQQLASSTAVKTYNALFVDVAEQIRVSQQPDSIIYVNVLEHIEDDEQELRAVWNTLDAGGRCFIFVPALPWLYGNFDKEVGHFRRYQKPQLEALVRRAGFRILKSSYFDLFGVPLWWMQYRLFKASTLSPGSVRSYDRLVVPLTKAIEGLIEPPLGKNLLLIAEKD